MLALEEIKQKLKEVREDLKQAGVSLNLEEKERELKTLKTEQENPELWNDLQKAQELNKKVARLENLVDEYSVLLKNVDDLFELLNLLESENDVELENEFKSSFDKTIADVEKYNIKTLLSGKYDGNNAILTLHSGAGGTEACDWTSMLYRMYSRYVERSGFRLIEMDRLDGDEAGIKSVTFKVEGMNAYGLLKAEKGVHRLVRISPFDSNARRHTSFASLEVMPEIINDGDIEIRTEEIKVDTFRSSGAGGQHVNKTESAIRITHLPTGIVVACQNERSQVQNKEMAMNMLRSKLIEKREQEQMDEAAAIKGLVKKIEWGSQIRSYVFQPYTMVKDHRTGFETGNITAVMDGEIEGFIDDFLRKAYR